MWQNWAGDQRCDPAHRATPGDVEEVRGLVRAAAARGECVRVVGAGHSFGDNVLTDGTLLSLDRVAGVSEVDTATGLVRVAAGTRLHDLSLALDEHGLAMANLGDIDVQSVAGAISTGTHGTGERLGNLATCVESLELVTADGEVRELAGEDLRAARVSVGALGVVTAYTLRTVPAFRLRERRGRAPLADVLDGLEERVTGHDHFELFCFPHAGQALTKELDRTEGSPTVRGRVLHRVDTVLENQALDLLCRAGRRFPSRIPRINRLVTSLAGSSVRTARSFEVFSSPRLVRFTETEWAFPRESCAQAVREILALAERYDVNFPLEVRFVAGDTDSMLSPAYDRPTAYVAAHAYQGMAWRDYFAGVAAIGFAHGARPHWGKRHELGAAELSALYPEWDAFQDVRRRLDPDGVFANAHVQRVFG